MEEGYGEAAALSLIVINVLFEKVKVPPVSGYLTSRVKVRVVKLLTWSSRVTVTLWVLARG